MSVFLSIYPLALRVSFGIASTVYRSVMDSMLWSLSCGLQYLHFESSQNHQIVLYFATAVYLHFFRATHYARIYIAGPGSVRQTHR